MSPELIESVPRFLSDNGMNIALRGGEYVPEDTEKLEGTLSAVRGRCRFYAETLRKEHDNEECWQQMTQLGYNIIMGNKPYEFIRFLCRKQGFAYSWRF